MMKKGIYAILAALAVFALVMTGCPSPADPPPPPPPVTKPDLAPLEGGFFTVNEDDVEMRITVNNASTITAANLKYEWYKASDTTSAGTAVGTNSRDFAPDVTTAGTTYYWVVVTNTATEEETTSNKAKVIVYTPSADTAVERIVVQNAAMPLWEFELPADADWADYEELSIEYYVSKFSKIADPQADIRSRAYGAYFGDTIYDDFATPDTGNAQGWGTPATRIVNWNATTFRGKGNTDSNREINNNNNFIIDNSRGTNNKFGAMFTAEGGAPSKWFKVKYATNAGIAEDFAKVPNIVATDHDTIFVGAGIFGPGGNANDVYEFYVKNPTLLSKEDPNKNIIGKPVKTGTTEQLFAGNMGSNRGATTRSVLSSSDNSYEDIDGQIQISFDLKGGTGNFPAIKIMTGDTLPTSFFSIPDPVRNYYDFDGWYDGATKITATTTFTDTTVVEAKWTSNTSRLAHPYPSATADTIVEIGALNNTSSNNQPGWDSKTDGTSFTVAEFVWATKLVFTLTKEFTGGCRLNWGNESAGWGTPSHDTYITGNDGTPTDGVMTVTESAGAFTYTVDLTKLKEYSDMIMSQTMGQLYFQYWGSGDFSNFATIKPTDAQLIIPKP
jgi:hypothetical protein